MKHLLIVLACVCQLSSCVGVHKEPNLPAENVAILKLKNSRVDFIDSKLTYNPMGVWSEPSHIKVMPGEHRLDWSAYNDLASLQGWRASYSPVGMKLDMKAGHVYSMCYGLLVRIDGGALMTLDQAAALLAREPSFSKPGAPPLKIALYGFASPERVVPQIKYYDKAAQEAWNKAASSRIATTLCYFAHDETTDTVISSINGFDAYLKRAALLQRNGNYTQW